MINFNFVESRRSWGSLPSPWHWDNREEAVSSRPPWTGNTTLLAARPSRDSLSPVRFGPGRRMSPSLQPPRLSLGVNHLVPRPTRRPGWAPGPTSVHGAVTTGLPLGRDVSTGCVPNETEKLEEESSPRFSLRRAFPSTKLGPEFIKRKYKLEGQEELG